MNVSIICQWTFQIRLAFVYPDAYSQASFIWSFCFSGLRELSVILAHSQFCLLFVGLSSTFLVRFLVRFLISCKVVFSIIVFLLFFFVAVNFTIYVYIFSSFFILCCIFSWFFLLMIIFSLNPPQLFLLGVRKAVFSLVNWEKSGFRNIVRESAYALGPRSSCTYIYTARAGVKTRTRPKSALQSQRLMQTDAGLKIYMLQTQAVFYHFSWLWDTTFFYN